jgi:oxygen-independent coproporphyrinogen-3 oxidase
MAPYSIYLHIPFCSHRCGYCDFNTYAGLEAHIPEYVSALCAEIEWVAASAGQKLPAHTVFFGGGTPSLLPAREIERILTVLKNAFDLQPDLELSLEANPGTLTRSYLHDLHSLGVNRLSLGVQSTHPGELKLLERIHTYPEAIQSVTWARQAGFENLNLDLIFGLPEQTLQTWQRTIQLALGLNPEHFSLYALTIEQDTPFGHWSRRGLLSPPDPDLAADMYEWAAEKLANHDYAQYEISNWARTLPPATSSSLALAPGYACNHNLQYWRNLPYLGLGAGAHGYAAGFRTENILSPITYIQRFKNHLPPPGLDSSIPIETNQKIDYSSGPPGAASKPASNASHAFPWTPANLHIHPIDRSTEIGETMMMGLRLTREGVSEQGFMARFGQSLEQVFKPQIERLESLGLLEKVSHKGKIVLRLTSKGRLLGNQVFMEFI